MGKYKVRPVMMSIGLLIVLVCLFGFYDHYRTQSHWDDVQARGAVPFEQAMIDNRVIGFRIALGGLLVGTGLCVWSILSTKENVSSKTLQP